MQRLNIILAAIALTLCSAAKPALAFSVLTDESVFLSQFNTPSEVINFDQPAPGALTGISYGLGGGATAYEVKENGWSDNINIGTLRAGDCCWTATTWYGSYISPSIYDRPDNWLNRIYLSLNNPVSALSVRTSSGFIGLVPTNPGEKYFELPVDVTVSEIALGYRSVSSVPEPMSFELACAAMLVFALRGRRFRISNGTQSAAVNT